MFKNDSSEENNYYLIENNNFCITISADQFQELKD